MSTPPILLNVIANDGPAGAGKEVVSRRAASHLGFNVLDSGALYRIFGWRCILEGVLPENRAGVERVVTHTETHRITINDGILCFDNKSVSQYIRTPEVDKITSPISKYPFVRAALLPLQRAMASQGRGLVADGRDMGSVVFPNAKLKIFLTATPEVRAKRRHDQYVAKAAARQLKTPLPSYEEVLADLNARDHEDMTRPDSPLVQAPDAHRIDSDSMTIDQVVERIFDLWLKVSKV